MKNLIQKSLFTVFVVLLSTGAQAATFNKLMKLGIVNSNTSNIEVIIYNDDQTKCLSTSKQNGKPSKLLVYGTCHIDGADTWVITNLGRIKNKHNGKCLSTPTGKDNLVLGHCNYKQFRDYTAHDLVILDHLVNDKRDVSAIADLAH